MVVNTKSISRFDRNTEDSLSAIRLLKSHNFEIYFEKVNIYTFDSKGENAPYNNELHRPRGVKVHI